MTPERTARHPGAGELACLVLMLKAPQRAKRRMVAAIGELATTAATLLTDCALEDAAAWPGPVRYAVAEPADFDWLERRLGRPVSALLQHGRNLGERINDIDRRLRAEGETRQIYVGSDCPALDHDYLLEAAQALERYDGVLAPAADGGVVAMGARTAWPDLAALPWSRPALGESLLALCRRERWEIAMLATRADVDTVCDLLRAAPLLAADARPARQRLGRWLQESRESLEAHL